MGSPASNLGKNASMASEKTISARGKYSCPACGGEAEWSAAKQKLMCAFCGTQSPAQIDETGTIVERDLASALRAIPEAARGWQREKRFVRCQQCEAISVFDAAKQAQACEFCASSAIVPYEETKEIIRPESVLPFKLSEPQARERIRKWYGELWWAPNALKKRALTDTVRGMYLPYWTFDALVDAQWEADSGYYYYETERYQDNDGETRTRQVQRVRWQRSSGAVNHFFDDELVCGSRGIHPKLLRAVEPFPTTSTEMRPYDAAYVAGWNVERYQIDLIAAAQASRDQMQGKTETMCSSQVPGDTQRNLNVQADFSRQTFKHTLMPVWLLSYTYGAKSYQVVMNGVTGQLAGEHPKSWVKITLAVLLVLIILFVVLAVGGRR
jgi:hypothetical protein